MSNDQWLTSEREHERQMAELQHKQRADDRLHKRAVMEQWTQRTGIVVSGLAVVAIILGITYSVWDGTNKQREANERVITACTDSGGTWTYLGGTSGGKTCVYLKDSGQ